ncbi:MAG: type II toxin-antitoxin system RelE/ParE family toxin [Pseudomonadota bacterium]
MADKRLRLSNEAVADLDRIWDYSAETWGAQQAEHYTKGLHRSLRTIGLMPEAGREHLEFDPPLRIYPSAKHLIIYRNGTDEIRIVRILASRTNWQTVLGC